MAESDAEREPEPEPVWRKASFSAVHDCVEVAWHKSSRSVHEDCVNDPHDGPHDGPHGGPHGGVVLLRDSDQPEVVVRIRPASWDAFVAGVKAGEFDTPTAGGTGGGGTGSS